MARITVAGRQVAPEYGTSGVIYGGLGPVPRRGWDSGTLNYLAELQKEGVSPNQVFRSWAEAAPLRLLRILLEIHPLAQFALESDLSLSFGPEDTQFVAIKDYQKGAGTVDDDGTALLDSLWDTYRTGATRDVPAITRRGRPTSSEKQLSGATQRSSQGAQSNVKRLQDALGTHLTQTGQLVLEAVPGANGSGVSQSFDIDPLNVLYTTDKEKRVRLAQVRKPTDYLDTRLIYDGAWRATSDNPYGFARCGSFLSVGLDDVSDQRNQTDFLHAVAWSRLGYEFPFERVAQFALDNPQECLTGKGADGKDLEPGDYASKEFQKSMALLDQMQSSDVLGGIGKVYSLGSGSAAGLEGILNARRLRLCQALQQLPNLMGITDGGTQAYASVQMTAHAQKLESFRAAVNDPLVWLANLHFRLQGIDMICRCESKPLLLTDLKAHHEAREIEIRNVFALVDRGYLTEEEGSVTLTGAGIPEGSKLKDPQPTPGPADKNENEDEDED
ncbi:MAG: hypothetical protein V4671_20235 [Armatimonadota bacterium]